MEDDELKALRAKRMAELQGQSVSNESCISIIKQIACE